MVREARRSRIAGRRWFASRRSSVAWRPVASGTAVDVPGDAPVDDRPVTMHVSLAVAVGLAVGIATAYLQGWLGDELASLANSAGPWSLAAFLVARLDRRVWLAVVTATLTLACCEVGYAMANDLRGGSNATSTVMFWLTAAALAGPPLGVAAAWSASTGHRRAIGWAVIGGVLVGEGVYGWTTVADTTDWRYWAVETALGAMIAVWAVVTGRSAGGRALAASAAVATAVVVLATARLA